MPGLLVLDYVLHLDAHLREVIQDQGAWSYLILCVTIFAENGIVLAPFLPGDSLLFAAGTFAGAGYLEIGWLVPSLTLSAILGDTFNYWVGTKLRRHVLAGKRIRFVRQEHLDRATAFYARHGGKTIVIARFIPILRTFAPFVAGVGAMDYRRFTAYNIGGGVVWVLVCTLAGYFVGNIPIVRQYFPFAAAFVIGGTVLLMVVEAFRGRARRARPQPQQ
jgi:membrane-associated protein